MMTEHNHRLYYRGHEACCADCGTFLFDVRTGARLAALKDVDPARVAAVKESFSTDPELAYRLAHEDMREVVLSVFMDKEPGTCPTCGDPMAHGKCKRCDWSAAPSNAMTDGEPIADPTKEIKPAIQS